MEADLVIFTGFIEPHFFAGFSGGPKGALPALAGHESVLTNHRYAMIGDPRATWGITEGNPIWEEMREAALLVEPLFLLNVTLNAGGELTGVFAGDVIEAHRRGCAFVRDSAMVPVEEPFDAVVTTNSGYPLDQNLYQTVKGCRPPRALRASGAIVLAAACEDGLPRHGRYAELLAEAGSPDAILELLQRPGFSAQDQWQVQWSTRTSRTGRISWLPWNRGQSLCQRTSRPCSWPPRVGRSHSTRLGPKINRWSFCRTPTLIHGQHRQTPRHHKNKQG